MLHLDYHGDLKAARGLIRQEDRDAVSAQIRSNAKDDGSDAAVVDLPPVKTRPVHSAALTNRLQAQRVIALQAEIIQQPNPALCLRIQQLLSEVGNPMARAYQTPSFDLSATSAYPDLQRTDAAMEHRRRGGRSVGDGEAKSLRSMKKGEAAAAAERLPIRPKFGR